MNITKAQIDELNTLINERERCRAAYNIVHPCPHVEKTTVHINHTCRSHYYNEKAASFTLPTHYLERMLGKRLIDLAVCLEKLGYKD